MNFIGMEIVSYVNVLKLIFITHGNRKKLNVIYSKFGCYSILGVIGYMYSTKFAFLL